MTWQMTSADDVLVMTSPRVDVSKRNLARGGAWQMKSADAVVDDVSR